MSPSAPPASTRSRSAAYVTPSIRAVALEAVVREDRERAADSWVCGSLFLGCPQGRFADGTRRDGHRGLEHLSPRQVHFREQPVPHRIGGVDF
jgi:hypothetical protein